MSRKSKASFIHKVTGLSTIEGERDVWTRNLFSHIKDMLVSWGWASMAQNHNHKGKEFEIETKFWHWYRRGLFKWLFNYYVGQRVWLYVYVKKTGNIPIDFSAFEIFEKSNSGSEVSRGKLAMAGSGELAYRGIKSNQLWEQGNYKIFLRRKTPKKDIDYILMDANIIHPDVRNRVYVQIFLAAILGAIAGAAFTYIMLIP